MTRRFRVVFPVARGFYDRKITMDGVQHTTEPYTRIDHSNPQHARTVLVDWMLGNACSYACSYCPKALHDGTIRWQKTEDVLTLYHQMKSHYAQERNKLVWLQFTGGEPTMHPRIIDLLKEASALGFRVSLISNASRTVRFWHKIRDYLDSVILTYHNEFATLDHFIDVGQLLVEQMNVHINVTMHPERFERTYDEARALRAALPKATITLKPLRVGFESELYDYSDAQLRILGKGVPSSVRSDGITPRSTMQATTATGACDTLRANDFILQDINRWQGYQCNIGLESLRIKGSGEVLRAVCGVGGRIGQLGGEIALPTQAIQCTKPSCACVADILTTKAKPVTAA
ncbi:radical SAM protein [Roseobacter sp. YSTF-M11]|uniref:Radical SAM protein n=1 Tax=Roseobacter insulae TaxID=2859783 RepID=A0A9X1K168_9RHOB|nr:radical SAM protein [Roseobacter insulae]MBW4708914.1 radical SAM protein [Roseobacter insulae]